MVKEKIQYHAHVKLGVVGSKAYAEELAGIFKNTYKAGNVKVVKEGNYYRVYADFTSKASAEKACKELKDKKYIINYYIE
jgi:Rps23 Pro-64 3,4-dihydroxylase Tpa1-like proline 4-hydroxylase